MSRLAILILGMVLGAAAVVLTLSLWLDPGSMPTTRVQASMASGAAGESQPLPSQSPGYPPQPAPVSMSTAPVAPSAAVAMEQSGISGSLTNTAPPSVVRADESEPASVLPVTPSPAGLGLLVPVAGVKPTQLVDTFTQSRGEGRLHDAIDIMATRGTPVFATADGRVAKLFNSKPGGLTVYQFDVEEKLAYYYAHLDSYAPTLVEGQQLHRGDVIGYVGSTGNANPDAPHLHFAVFILGPDKKWWQGTAINPYPLLSGGG